METLKLKICHYLNCESHIHLGVLLKTNAKGVKRMQKNEKRTDVKTVSMQNIGGAVGVFTRSVLSMPSGKILDRNCESLFW